MFKRSVYRAPSYNRIPKRRDTSNGLRSVKLARPLPNPLLEKASKMLKTRLLLMTAEAEGAGIPFPVDSRTVFGISRKRLMHLFGAQAHRAAGRDLAGGSEPAAAKIATRRPPRR
jgi:hypothetical protein